VTGNVFLLELYSLFLQLGVFVGLWVMFGKIGYLALRELDGSLYQQHYTIYDGDAVFICYILGPVSLICVTFLYLLGRYFQLGLWIRRIITKSKQKKKTYSNWDN
jgi:hypothetical protein